MILLWPHLSLYRKPTLTKQTTLSLSLFFPSFSLSLIFQKSCFTACVYDGGRRRKKYGGRSSQAEEPKRRFRLSYYSLCYSQHFRRRLWLLLFWSCCEFLFSINHLTLPFFLLQICIFKSVNTMLKQNQKINSVSRTKIIIKSNFKSFPR